MRKNLHYRLITSFLFIPALIIITRKGSVHYLLLIAAGIGVGVYEFFLILEEKGIRPYKILGILSALLLCLSAYSQSYLYTFLVLTALLFFLSVAEFPRKDPSVAILHISTTFYGILFVGWLLSHFILLRELPHELQMPYEIGGSFALLPFVLAWSYDTAAFFIGTRFGKFKLLPRISPAKSWEGSIAGLFACLIAVSIFKEVYASYLSWIDCIILGIGGSFLAQIGDLVESLLKRDAKVKNASEIIPGHGGILDRFDSLLFVAPVVYYYLRFHP
jgi:phosphatidate cytidylyltransferase